MNNFRILILLGCSVICGINLTCSSKDAMTRVEPEIRPRVIVTTDAEIDDECSMVRFMLYMNDWDVEGIITTSSQYHWEGHRWAGTDWMEPYLDAYEAVYPNLIKHDKNYPTPEYVRSITVLGNIKSEGDMEEETEGSDLIVQALLDESDERPIWLQAWGGTNTIARALKTIEEKYPDKMQYVANKARLYCIWEQDPTYQEYIRPVWEPYNILSIISDQFWAVAYEWDKIQPEKQKAYFVADWMKENILEKHGPLCSLYKAHDDGRFRSEGDSPSFFHTMPTGLRSMESPAYGGWGGRYVKVRANTWLDEVPEKGYVYPEGRWFTESAWGRTYMRERYPEEKELMYEYFKPIWRWSEPLQKDFAARADWCVKPYSEANHAPVVTLKHDRDLVAKRGEKVQLQSEAYDPDNDQLTYRWWQYEEADSFSDRVSIENAQKPKTAFRIPNNAKEGDTIHIICEVTDNGTPNLTRYQRVIIKVKE
jgi:hypothetical protein